MNCKNCGTRLSEKAKVCPNCGAFVDDSSGYTLLASDDRIYDVYSTEKKQKKKNSPLKNFIIFLLVILIAGGGGLLFFGKIQPMLNKPPELTFKEGSGIINKDEKVIYVLLDKNSDIQYIHGVKLYDYDKTSGELRDAVSDEYEYTKSIDSTFRAIYFDMKDFNLVNGEKYTYTFEMKFSFNGSEKIHTYTDAVSFDGEITEDASDIVFDHSLNEGSQGSGENKKGTTAASTESKEDYSFIHEGYWYTYPSTQGNVRSISAFKFDKSNNYTVTDYTKNGNEDWKVSTEKGTYKIQDGAAVLDNGASFELDSANDTIAETADGKVTQLLTNRKYNSIQNTEDFFGL